MSKQNVSYCIEKIAVFSFETLVLRFNLFFSSRQNHSTASITPAFSCGARSAFKLKERSYLRNMLSRPSAARLCWAAVEITPTLNQTSSRTAGHRRSILVSSARRTRNHVPDSWCSTKKGRPASARTARNCVDCDSLGHLRKYHGN